jgi:Fic family protein
LHEERGEWTGPSPSNPGFRYDRECLASALSQARLEQGGLLGRAAALDTRELPLTHQIVWAEEALVTAAIDGELLDPAAVRLSVARRLGLPATAMVPVSRNVEALLDVMEEAVAHWGSDLSWEQLARWHAALCRGRAVDPAQGAQAASAPGLAAQTLRNFLAWFNGTRDVSPADGIVRAGMAQLWFESIRPFDQANGRIGRAIVARALAQDARAPNRLLGIAARMRADQARYDDALDRARRGGGDITPWLAFFIETFTASCRASSSRIDELLARGRFWSEHRSIGINQRQRKALSRMLEAGPGRFAGGMTVRKYQLITNTTRVTASRDLAQLGQVGLLARQGAGRSTFYNLPMPGWAWVPARTRR